MSSDEILDEVRQLLGERLRITAPVDRSTDLLRDLQLDSIQRLGLVVELENRFRICFDASDEAGIATVEQLVTVIGRRLAAQERS